MTNLRLLFYFVAFFSFTWGGMPLLSLAQQKTASIIFDQQNNSFRFTAGEMKKDLQKAGYDVTLTDIRNSKNIKSQSRFILTVRGTSEVKEFLKKQPVNSLPASKSQGYSVRKSYQKGEWYIIGFDHKGAIYGGLDVSEAVKLKGVENLEEVDKQPYIENRGIKFNIPLDARTPSYSDNADAAQQNIIHMWDIAFWHEFLDEMARDRFNVLSLWSLSPFPSLVDVPEYPGAGLNDVKKSAAKLAPTTDGWYMSTPSSLAQLNTIKKISLAEKIAFWNDVMRYARDRGIDCYLFTWNLFTYGTERSGYGFTDKISDVKTKDYIRKATKSLIRTYPLLKGIGITAGENMYRLGEAEKEKFLFESYGEGINEALHEEPGRNFKLIHRAHQADINIIKNAFAGLHPNCTISFSYKYSVAQMYSARAPNYIYESKFLDHIGDSKFFLTVREDAWYNLRGGSDPAFTRAYFKNMPKKNLEGFYVGPDGYTMGREYISKDPATPRQLVLKKRWYSFQLLGRLSYDPEIQDAHFASLLHDRFPEVEAEKLQMAWALASQVMPLVNRFHNGKAQNDFQWYPEACTSFYGFRDINNFINSAPQPGEGLMSIPEHTSAVLQHKTMSGTTPLSVADSLQRVSDQALKLVAEMPHVTDKELRQTIADIKAMAFLGQYYAAKISGAAYKDLFDKAAAGKQKDIYKATAVQQLKTAANYWRNYASALTASYVPQYLTRMHFTVDFNAIQASVDKEVYMMENSFADQKLDRTPPVQQLEVVFSNHSNYYYWHLDKMDLPADWTSYNFLVLEVFATSRQPFDLWVQSSRDTLVHRGLTPLKNNWTHLVVPIETLKLGKVTEKKAGASNRQTVNQPVLLDDVLSLGVLVAKPVGYPVLEIRSMRLLKDLPVNENSNTK